MHRLRDQSRVGVTAHDHQVESPDKLAPVIRTEIPKWAKVIKEAGIKPD